MNYNIREREFKRGAKLGRGGNGDVYKLDSIDGSFPSEYVIKFLRIDRNKYFDKKYERFKREVEEQTSLSAVEGVLPILKSNLPENPTTKNLAWYIMPKAESISDLKLNAEEKITLMRDLGETLVKIHSKGIAHRDIKPENILFYKKRLVFSDFGLVWVEGKKRITGGNERVGPWNTISPEMKRDAYNIQDPRPADVYSFAKTLWILLMNDNNCFDGQYNKFEIYSLKDDIFEDGYIETLHKVIESSTSDNTSIRPSIKEVVEELNEWFKIISDPILLNEKRRELRLKKIDNDIEPDIKEYNTFEKINRALKILFPKTKEGLIYFSSIKYDSIRIDEFKSSKISECLEIKSNSEYYIVNPIKLTKKGNVCSIDIGHIEYQYSDKEKYKPIKDRRPLYGIQSDVKWILDPEKDIKINYQPCVEF